MKITKRQLRRIIREERIRLREDSIADELDHLRKNKEDDLEHIDALEKDIEDDREEMKRAEDAKKDESFRRRSVRRKLRRIVRETHEDWGMGGGEQSRTHSGEDYTGHAGDESKTHPGDLDYEGGDVETKAMDAMAAIHDLASAAGVELATDVAGPGDEAGDDDGLPMESRRRRRLFRRIVRENTRSRRRRNNRRRRR